MGDYVLGALVLLSIASMMVAGLGLILIALFED
jgi:hypothetical protein